MQEDEAHSAVFSARMSSSNYIYIPAPMGGFSEACLEDEPEERASSQCRRSVE